MGNLVTILSKQPDGRTAKDFKLHVALSFKETLVETVSYDQKDSCIGNILFLEKFKPEESFKETLKRISTELPYPIFVLSGEAESKTSNIYYELSYVVRGVVYRVPAGDFRGFVLDGGTEMSAYDMLKPFFKEPDFV